MKKLFLLLLVLTLFANDKDIIQAQILEKIIQNLSTNQKVVVWSDNREIIKEFNKKGNIATTQDCHLASIIILEDKKSLEKELCKKAVFVLDYALLSEIPHSFGSMFYKKGRPNIVIINSRIKEQNIKISKELEPYLEEKIW
ncbi:MAG: hypothetical protein PHX44_10365 [Sulfurimonas sp.]|uniref:hypothetical protein n=1 Tax=Sulfurimonas sp. TaxID=2022749 RepID=UPI0026354C9A|nr:hypothetical protein [Sulfurimonas sp.]MDD2653436.1 hypothetical protein [Sulfurimonas sp.]MDD3452643.1 hypothetical protein [Sulfurimonas sp.]